MDALLLYKKKTSFNKNFFKKNISKWMSHQDAVSKLPSGFHTIASTKNSKLTIIENTKKKNIWSSISSRSNAHRKWKKNN